MAVPLARAIVDGDGSNGGKGLIATPKRANRIAVTGDNISISLAPGFWTKALQEGKTGARRDLAPFHSLRDSYGNTDAALGGGVTGTRR